MFTSNTEGLQKLIPELEQAFAKDRTRTKAYGADMWDKNTRYTPKEWVAQLKQDLESGQNSYVWTSIPDKVTQQLKRLGYDATSDANLNTVNYLKPYISPKPLGTSSPYLTDIIIPKIFVGAFYGDQYLTSVTVYDIWGRSTLLQW